MAGVLCVWANLPDDMIQWYEDEYIPEMRSRNSVHTLHCERVESGFEGEPIGTLDSPWPLCSVYEVPEIRAATDSCYDKANHPSEEMLSGPLSKARFDVRTYREVKRWQAQDWDGDVSHIASIAVMEWHVSSEMQDEVVSWYTSYVMPLVASSSDLLRIRYFEVDNATVLQGMSYETKDKDALHTYFSLLEFETEEWPWDVILELADNKQWKQYFEAQRVVKWQVGSYMVKRVYEDEKKEAARQQ